MTQSTTPGNVVATVAAPGAVALPTDIATKLAAYAAETQQTEIAAGQFFSTRAAQLSFGGQALPNNAMDVVIVASMFESVYYPEKFNSDKIQPPTCYAFAQAPNGMVPHPEATTPQAKSCAECPHSKWATDPVDKKNRKACKEQRRLACMPMSALGSAGDNVDAAVVGYLRVPVTSVKHWQAYAQSLAGRGKPPFAVVTRIKLSPDAKTQMRLDFTHVRDITDPDEIEAVMLRSEREKVSMAFPYARASVDSAAPTPAAAPAPSKF